MKKALLPIIVTCLGSITVVLTTGRVANPDITKVIPYPEVMNLKRVPIFNDKGMVAQTIDPRVAPPVKIAANKPPEQYSPKKMSELLLKHQTLAEIDIVGTAAPVESR